MIVKRLCWQLSAATRGNKCMSEQQPIPYGDGRGTTREELLRHREEHPEKRVRPLQTGHGQPRKRNRPPPFSEMHVLAYAPHQKALLLEPYLIHLALDHSDGCCVNKSIDARGMKAAPNFLYIVIADLVGLASQASPVVHPTNQLRFTS